MGTVNLLDKLNHSGWDKINVKIGKWRILAVFLFGLGYFLFYHRELDWVIYWLIWLLYAALWLPLQGRHRGENPNAWTYFFLVGDVFFLLLSTYFEHDILNNYSTTLILPLFQYLIRYGRKVALQYVWVSVAAVVYICVAYYMVHPENHFVVAVVMFLIAYNEGMLIQENRDLRKQLFNLAIYDELTGLYNFRFFSQAIEREISRSNRYGHPLTILLMDIDNFKKINDIYGHNKGNEVLKGLAETVLKSIRDSDYAARYGGEEFVLILPQTPPDEGFMVAERIRENISRCQFDFGNVTVSMGVANHHKASDREDLLKRADMAMYAAKKNGKNRVEIDPE